MPETQGAAPDTKKKRISSTSMCTIRADQNVDIQEMWFAGDHSGKVERKNSFALISFLLDSDIGGGSRSSDYPYNHSRISLRWLIRECARSQLGLEFREEELWKLFLDTQGTMGDDISSSISNPILPDNLKAAFEALATMRINNKSLRRNLRENDDGNEDYIEKRLAEVELRDCLMPIHDATQKFSLWKLLGTRSRCPNDPILLHRSVRWRQDACKWVQEPECDPWYKDIAERLGVANYKPRAQFNEWKVKWDDQLSVIL